MKERFKTKLSKRQKRRNILVFIIVLIAFYLVNIVFGYLIGSFEYWTLYDILVVNLFTTFFTTSMLIIPVFIAAIILGAQKGKTKRVQDDSTFIPVYNLDYYRDHLNELNPALVSLLIDLDLYGNKDVIATLLRMKNKQAISFGENDKINIINKNIPTLDNSEKELLNFLENNKLNIKKHLLQWKKNRFIEAEQMGYIKKKKVEDKSKTLAIHFLFAILSLMASFVLWGSFLSFEIYNDIDSIMGMIKIMGIVLMIDVLIFFPFYLFSKNAYYYKRGDVVWERTDLGHETAEKIAGLGRFIKEFSTLSEAKKEQVVLWQDYLVYAIVLEENQRIVKDISQRYQINLHIFNNL